VFVIIDIARRHARRPRPGGPAAAAGDGDASSSGGVATLADVAALKAVPGIAGVITGKALYEGRFTVAEALLELAR
jgi:phosphoribosylformimino-5-aminoimidazole carboxamide ribotide isomerase